MNWYKYKIKAIFGKEASKKEIRDRALNALQGGGDANQIINQFITDMSIEDPTFQPGPLLMLAGDPNAAVAHLQGMDVGEEPVPTQVDVQRADAPPEEIVEPDGKEGEKGAADEEVGGAPLTRQLDAPPGLEEKVTSDPTLLESFEIPSARVNSLVKRLSTTNKRLKDMFYPEISVQISDPYPKPVRYNNGTYNEDFVRVKISGTLPSPSEVIRIKKYKATTARDGSTKWNFDGYEPVGVRLIAKITHIPLDEDRQQHYLNTLPPDSPLRGVIEESRNNRETPFFNQVEPLDSAPPIDGNFWYSSPQYCHACQVKKAGATARKATYVGVVVPQSQMTDKTMIGADGREQVMMRNVINKGTGRPEQQPVKVINDEDIANAQQQQFGGKCIDPFDAVKTINNLKRWVNNARKFREEYEKAKAKKKYKGGGWGITKIGSDILFATAIHLLRDPSLQDNDYRLGSRLWRDSRAYERKQKDMAKPDYDPANYRPSRYIGSAPDMSEEDFKIGKEARRWWMDKVGGLDLDEYADGKNKVNLSIVSTIGLKDKNLRNVIAMVKTYLESNGIALEPAPIEEPEQIAAPPASPAPTQLPAPVETILDKPKEEVAAGVDNIAEVGIGEPFTAKLKFIASRPFKRNARSFVNEFRGQDGTKYILFTNGAGYGDAQPGEEIYVRGTKGITNDRYRNTQIKNLEIIAPETTPEAPAGLPSWYGKYNLGELAEQRIIKENKNVNEVIEKFFELMAQISPRFQDPEARANYIRGLKAMNKTHGPEIVVKVLKKTFNEFKPKLQNELA